MTSIASSRTLVALVLTILIACNRGEQPSSAAAGTPAAGVVDSALPMPELLARLQAKAGPSPDSLRGASPSRDALVRRFVRSLASADTADLARAVLTLPEFAWLYYPDHPYSRAPYEMYPELAWIQYQGNGDHGWQRLRARFLGKPATLVGYSCDDPPRAWTGNREWTQCTVRLVRSAKDTVAAQLFGSIVEHGGRFKFVTYANKL